MFNCQTDTYDIYIYRETADINSRDFNKYTYPPSAKTSPVYHSSYMSGINWSMSFVR